MQREAVPASLSATLLRRKSIAFRRPHLRRLTLLNLRPKERDDQLLHRFKHVNQNNWSNKGRKRWERSERNALPVGQTKNKMWGPEKKLEGEEERRIQRILQRPLEREECFVSCTRPVQLWVIRPLGRLTTRGSKVSLLSPKTKTFDEWWVNVIFPAVQELLATSNLNIHKSGERILGSFPNSMKRKAARPLSCPPLVWFTSLFLFSLHVFAHFCFLHCEADHQTATQWV